MSTESSTDKATNDAEETPTERLSYEDFTGTLTGYEEDEIAEKFGNSLGRLAIGSISKSSRALLYIELRRLGRKKEAAYQTVMKMTLREVNDRFWGDDEDPASQEFDPDNPVSDEGKDGSSDG